MNGNGSGNGNGETVNESEPVDLPISEEEIERRSTELASKFTEVADNELTGVVAIAHCLCLLNFLDNAYNPLKKMVLMNQVRRIAKDIMEAYKELNQKND